LRSFCSRRERSDKNVKIRRLKGAKALFDFYDELPAFAA
jgi:hypothetical protein